MKLTRRKLATAVLGSAAAATALAQTPPPIAANPEAELKAARDRFKSMADTLSKLSLPMDTEPALQFKA